MSTQRKKRGRQASGATRLLDQKEQISVAKTKDLNSSKRNDGSSSSDARSRKKRRKMRISDSEVDSDLNTESPRAPKGKKKQTATILMSCSTPQPNRALSLNDAIMKVISSSDTSDDDEAMLKTMRRLSNRNTGRGANRDRHCHQSEKKRSVEKSVTQKQKEQDKESREEDEEHRMEREEETKEDEMAAIASADEEHETEDSRVEREQMTAEVEEGHGGVVQRGEEPDDDNAEEGDVSQEEMEEELQEEQESTSSEEEHGSVWSRRKALSKMLPGREKQVQMLLELFGEPSDMSPASLYVFGHTGVGKTLVMTTLMRQLNLPHAFVNSVECYSTQLLFETILNQLSGAPDCHSQRKYRCYNIADFIHHLSCIIKERELEDETVYLVIDRAERLREREPTLLPALMRLTELCQHRLCVVLISELVWNKLSWYAGWPPPLLLHFPPYTKDEVLEILSLDCPLDYSSKFYQTFISHVWGVLHSVCGDVGELRHLASMLFPVYCDPVKSGEIEASETRRLWRHIEPFFKSVMSKVYMRDLSSLQWESALSRDRDPLSVAKQLASERPPSNHVIELPYFSKFLLIAAYLASYNPAKTDKRFFSKTKQQNHSKSKRRTKTEQSNRQLLGPKSFPLDRLMAIFYSVLDERTQPSADILIQISSLVTLQLLARVSTGDVLDSVKYKCLAKFDLIREVSRSIGFEIVRYLYDFN